ncbi:calcium-binding protein [Cyanobium sp. LEGE 06113]|uniref:calcium-binding protein n=1 Tax=Cyanobium sp. LEGE 06113 TaxID=1297573 RepID=UPI00187EAB69|nr:calcium-binding protein [Cyanobium sp. LEGE 06113]MBE9154462.1 hypothetical protein [Cyanobium sp. LEGE 06113]
MALPQPGISIDGANPADQNQSFTGDDSNELFVVDSSSGIGTITGFKIKGEGGNDTLTLEGSPRETNVFGGDGDDILSVVTTNQGSVVDSKFFAGAGNDTVVMENVLMTGTGQGTSQIGTGSGRDEIYLLGDFFNNNFFAGDGDDLVEFTGPSSYKNSRGFTGDGDDTFTDGGFEVDFTTTEFGFKGGDDVVDLENSFTGVGSEGMQAFLGDGDDVFAGPASGDVTVLGGTGNDAIDTEDGNDSIEGGDDNDFITSGDGNDTVRGGEGFDIILGQEDEDLIFGDAGSDIIFGGNADDTIDGGMDADLVFGGFGDDSITGGEGASTPPTVGELLDEFLAQPFDDLENPIPNTVFTDDDTLVGGVGNDTITGESGDDLIYGGIYGGQLNGGIVDLVDDLSGVDLSDPPPIINEEIFDTLVAGNPELEDIPLFEAFTGIGEITGDDSIEGDSGEDIIFGGGGDDTIDGGGDDDIIMGNTGSDVMTGGSGADDFIQQGGDSSIVLGGSQFSFSPTGLSLDFGTNIAEGLFATAPDIITDFDARDGAGEVVDQIWFESVAPGGGPGNFVDMTNAPGLSIGQSNWGFNDIVVYRGSYDAATFTFETSNNGPDAFAFRAVGEELFLPADELFPILTSFAFGNQGVILEGAGDENFDAANFGSFA